MRGSGAPKVEEAGLRRGAEGKGGGGGDALQDADPPSVFFFRCRRIKLLGDKGRAEPHEERAIAKASKSNIFSFSPSPVLLL